MAALFDYAHMCVAARPDIATAGLPPAVARRFPAGWERRNKSVARRTV
jgi:hypothetical protein